MLAAFPTPPDHSSCSSPQPWLGVYPVWHPRAPAGCCGCLPPPTGLPRHCILLSSLEGSTPVVILEGMSLLGFLLFLLPPLACWSSLKTAMIFIFLSLVSSAVRAQSKCSACNYGMKERMNKCLCRDRDQNSTAEGSARRII